MSNLSVLTLISHYPVLGTLATHLSTLDLFNLSLTCKISHEYIQPSRRVFKALTSHSLCDGHGLIERQEFRGLYHIRFSHWSPFIAENGRYDDEPIETKLWETECEEADALPCIKCGVNVCEECRYQKREALKSGELYRKPFPHPNAEHDNFMAFCPSCDEKVEREVLAKDHFSSTCDCDTYTRWICLKCAEEEEEFTRKLWRKCVVGEGDTEHGDREEDEEWKYPTKVLGIHQSSVFIWCLCGEAVPQDAPSRCTWCKRRHPPEEKWYDIMCQMSQNQLDGDFKKFDPCYPVYNRPWTGYPQLAYDGPIWSEEERRAFVAQAASEAFKSVSDGEEKSS